MTAAQLPSVAVIGGGLAGLAAGCALAGAGFQVSLFERRPYLGGRASSYQHPGTGEVVDNCQHVLLGCCTNLSDLYRRIGAADKIRWYRHLTFIEPGGRQSVIEPGALPAPFHCATSFLDAHCLSLTDKLAISRAMMSLAAHLPADDSPAFLDWLRAHGQTPQSIDRFWRPVLVSALNEELERVSSRYAAQVFRESFLKSAQAGALGLPALPLSDLYGIAGDYIQRNGGCVHLRAAVDSMQPEQDGVRICAGGQEIAFDYAVLAVPFNVLAGMLPEGDAAAPLRAMLDRFQTSPITGVHLWFDRQITDLPHAVLLDRTIQWMFHKSSFQLPSASLQPVESRGRSESWHPSTDNSYLELVVSSSKTLVDKSKQEILDLALRELAEFFPEVRNAQLLKSTVIKEINATYSPLPGADAYRPSQTSPWPRIFLAGDWTATGWPATMEGAVRSGYLSAEALTASAGARHDFLVGDLPARGLMRVFARSR
jgi:squalene-associated FAD-dependent desaturase